MDQRTAIDVADLPTLAFDARSPVWWGNTLFTIIESMTIALLIASYFYSAQNFSHWPPPSVNRNPPIYDTMPDPGFGTANTILLLLSLAPMIAADQWARAFRFWPLVIALLVCVFSGILSVVLRIYEFQALKFRWDDNAYGSLVWALLLLHLTYLFLASVETAIIAFWLVLHGIDEKHAVDVTLTASYWYWMVGVWILIYGVVYWSPHLM